MSTLQAIADRVAAGGVLGPEDAAVVLASHDLITIGMIADEVRRGIHGARTTFLRVFEMHVGAVPPALPQSVEAGEFRLVGRPSSLDAACAAVERARRLAAGRPLTGFSMPDLEQLESASGELFLQLRQAGLDGIADAPVDRTTEVAIGRARAAGLSVLRLTVEAPPDDPASLLERVRRLQGGEGGFRAFAPLPRTTAGAPTTGYDDVKLVALARLTIPDIPSIQVDWPLHGPKLAQVALTMGADDVDGVAAVDSAGLGSRRTPLEEIKQNILAAGLHAVERDGWFEVVART